MKNIKQAFKVESGTRPGLAEHDVIHGIAVGNF